MTSAHSLAGAVCQVGITPEQLAAMAPMLAGMQVPDLPRRIKDPTTQPI